MIVWILLLLLLAFASCLLLRAFLFKPLPQRFSPRREVSFCKEDAISALQKLVQCKTVSFPEKEKEDDGEFQRLTDLLPQLYPEVFRVCEFIPLQDRALLLRWKGKASDKPSVLMAHYDVVPADESAWEKPPFEGVIENGVLWGRGTLDTKVTLNAILSAANTWIARGFVPQQDVYLAFSGGEEVSGPGAVRIVEYFEQNGIHPDLVLDEGGAVVEGVFPGVKHPCGLIGIAEKGMLNARFTVHSGGGHASAPKPHTPIGLLSKACCAIENHPFPMHISRPAREMFNVLGRHSTFPYRVIFSNLWLFRGVLNLLCKKNGGELNALLRTTAAFTQAEGSPAPNVIPPQASMTANLRLNPLDSVSGAMERLRKTVRNSQVEISALTAMEPSPVSQTDCGAWEKVASAVFNTWHGCIVAPYLMVQCSDSRHYRNLSDHVYRFSAMDLTQEERALIHGNNERIRLETALRAVEFYIRLIEDC